MALAERLIDLNRWYEALPDGQRVLVYPAVLVAAGIINSRWTGSPFGLVLLLTVVALITIRRSYISGWLASRVAAGGPPASGMQFGSAAAPLAASPRTLQPEVVYQPAAEPPAVEPAAARAPQEQEVPSAALSEASVEAEPAARTGRTRRGNGGAARKSEARSGRRKPSARRPDADPS